ncbi:MAG TPA: NAD(P)-dependent oxidoreductase [Elusimicrobiota bacterium]|nr:NAD(P)-dependent oxidoreductase [Elusimicrobiota bacterium]
MNALPSVGFIGLGIMGLPMARHLLAGGYPVTVFNRTASKAKTLESVGAKVAAHPKETASRCRVLITMLTDPAAIRQVMDGPDGFLAADNPDVVWIQMSTLDIASTMDFAATAKKKGWGFLDCPVTGSKKQVEAAELILLAGGPAGLLEAHRPLLMKMAKAIVHAGDVGAGSALKLCMNLIVAQMTTGLAEAAALADTCGIDPARIFDVLKESPALNCAYYQIKKEPVLKKDFSPAFSLANMLKDVRFMTKEAGGRGLDLPVTQAVRALMESALQEGRGDKDLMSIYLTLRRNKKSG